MLMSSRATWRWCIGARRPLVQKILHAQEAGAVGVVLVDDGRCESDLNCGRIGSARLGGFAPRDDPSSRRLVKIPSVLVSRETGKRIRRLMPLGGRGAQARDAVVLAAVGRVP